MQAIEYISVEIVAISQNALHVRADDGTLAWIAKKDIHSDSMIDGDNDKGDQGLLAIRRSLALSKGLC